MALSNMPEIDVENRKATGVGSLNDSTYVFLLLAFAAGDMQGITAKTKNGTLVGVYATKAPPSQNLEFALDIAVRCIEFYEEYYGVSTLFLSPPCGPARLSAGLWKIGAGNVSGNLSAGG